MKLPKLILFKKRTKPYIVFSGTHCSGKTTIAKRLKEELEKQDVKNIHLMTGIPKRVKELYKVPLNENGTIETQILLEKEFMLEEKENWNKFLIADRSIIDRLGYASYSNLIDQMNKETREWWKERVLNILQCYTLIFFIPLDSEIKLEDDGGRSLSLLYQEKINYIMNYYVTALQKLGISIHILIGTIEERLNQVMKAFKEEK